MKVLVCIPCLLTGGTEIQTLSLVKALIAAGHQVNIACYFEYAETMVSRFKEAGADVKLMASDSFRPKGLKSVSIHLYKGFKRIIKEIKPDVAHVQYMTPAALAIIILRILGVKTIIATSHTFGDIYSANGIKVIKFLTNYLLTAFQCITMAAEKSYFGSSNLFKGNLQKHFTIYNNIPDYISISCNPRNLNKDFITVGVVSRLEYIKGMDLVVPSFAKALRIEPHLRLLIVGDGSLRKQMEQQAKEEGISTITEFAGRQTQSVLQDFYDRIDILLMPSRSEGFGLTAIEGMARGCVPVVANVGGLPEVVTSKCGLLHEPENVNDISQKINSLLSDRNKLNRMSEEAIERAKDFSFENYKNQIKTLYSII